MGAIVKSSIDMFCSKKKGYFPFLAQKIQESLSVEDKSTFASFKTLEDRLKFVLSLPRLSSAYEDNLFKIIKPLRGEKSKEKSEENREAGNASFHSKNYRQAQVRKGCSTLLLLTASFISLVSL